MNLTTKERSLLLSFLLFVALLRLGLAPLVSLGVDEAHYALYALNLDLSYFDHPPLVGWIQYVFIFLFGEEEFGVRVAAILIGFFTSLFVYKLIYDVIKSANEAFLALLALHASFLFNALFITLMPDTLLFLLVFPIILTVVEIEKNGSFSMWILLGVLLGLAGLAKYTAVLFILPIILYVILKKRYDLLYDLKILPAILIALLIISPVIIWNVQNDWSSFAYQSNHVVGAESINWSGFFSSLGAQMGAYNPFLAPLAFYGLYKALRSDDSTMLLSALFGLVMISFFTYASLYKTALPHWSALFYLLFIPIGSFYATKLSMKYVKFAIGFGLLISSLAYAELAFKFIPFPDYKSVHRDVYGWDFIMKKANSHIKDVKKEAIAVPNWTLASRAIYYNEKYDSSVYLVDSREDQFDVWEDNLSIGKDLLFINTHFLNVNVEERVKCDKTFQVDEFDIILHQNIVNTIKLIRCKNYQGLK